MTKYYPEPRGLSKEQLLWLMAEKQPERPAGEIVKAIEQLMLSTLNEEIARFGNRQRAAEQGVFYVPPTREALQREIQLLRCQIAALEARKDKDND